MDRQALMAERDRLKKEVFEIERKIEQLDKEIQRGKIKKVCDLMRELWNDASDEVFEIENFDGETIDIDFEDLSNSIKRYYGI